MLAIFAVTVVVSACRPGPPPSAPQSELPPGSPAADSEPALSLAPETFTLDETAALYAEIRDEIENPDPDVVAQLELDSNGIEENSSEFVNGVPYKDVPGLEDSFRSFEQGDFLSAHNQLETAFKAFIAGKCFSPLLSECIALPEEGVVRVDPQFEYLPDPRLGGLRFSVVRKEAAFKIATLLRVLAARGEGMEVQPPPAATLGPADAVEATPVTPPSPAPVAEGVPQQASAPDVDLRTHTVAPGETLFSIASLYGTSVDELARANKLSNPSLILVGQELVIPGEPGAETK